MTETHGKYDSGCPVAYALDILGDRWSLLIIRDMAVRGAQTYGALLEGWEGISTNILAQRLKQLEQDGIVSKTRDPENRRSFRYALTAKGRDLAPVIVELVLWSGKYNAADNAMTGLLEKIRVDRAAVEACIRAGKTP